MNRFFRRWLNTNTNVLSNTQRATHTYVIGQPGTGKSRAIESWVLQDIDAGNGVGVIDPHGDLFYRLLVRISDKPKVWNRVVILDPCNPKWTVSFNPLESIKDFSPERLALFLTDVVMKMWKLEVSSSPRLIWLLTNSFLALSNLDLTLLHLPKFLQDRSFRESLLPQLVSEEARTFFQYEFPKSQGAVHQWITPVLNKIGGLIFDPDIRLILSGGSSLNFREVIDKKSILLVNLPKGIIGEEPSALMGAFIVAHLQKAALSRANTKQRRSFYLYLDEFQNYTTDNIRDVLSESRKYALSLILAHQYLDQLSPDMRSAVLNTAGTLVCFRVGYQDAQRLVRELFPSPNYLTKSERELSLERIGNLPFLMVNENQIPLGWDGLAQTLTKLPQRQYWSKRRGTYMPVKYRTFNVPDPVLSPEALANIAELLDASGQRFGTLKSVVQREYSEFRSHAADDKERHRERDEREQNDSENGIWS